jgi:hypothetical protein
MRRNTLTKPSTTKYQCTIDKFTLLAQKFWAMSLEEYTIKMTNLRRKISYSVLGKNIRVTVALKTTFKYNTYLSSSKKPS